MMVCWERSGCRNRPDYVLLYGCLCSLGFGQGKLTLNRVMDNGVNRVVVPHFHGLIRVVLY